MVESFNAFALSSYFKALWHIIKHMSALGEFLILEILK
jgi:hypothetical protein